MNNIIQTIRHTARAAAVLLIALLAAQTAWAWSGSGTSDDPYQIASASDLAQLATDVNGGTDYNDKYFKQTANITLTSAWTPIGTDSSHPFKGHYDGGGFAIRGLRVTGNYKHAGLFGYISSDYYHGSQIPTELKDINIVNCNIDVSSGGQGNGKAGGIAGYVNCFNMSNCKVSGTIMGYDYAAGLIGQAGSFCKMNDCFVDVTVNAHKADPNAQYPPAYCLIGQYLNNMSASGNYYHDKGGNVPSGISATPVYTVASQTDGLTLSGSKTTSFNGTDYYASGSNLTLTVNDADKAIRAVTVNGTGASSSVAANKKSATVTVGTADVTVSASLLTIAGTCGSGVTWRMTDTDSNGTYETLTISGSGAISSSPWATDFAATITRVNISSADLTISGNPFSTLGGSAVIVVPTPAYALGYSNAAFASKLRVTLGSQLFTATTEGGTPAYQIATADDLRNLAAAVNATKNISTGKTFRQTADIDLAGGGNFTPIGSWGGDYSFAGTYDGGGHTISGLTVSKEYANIGLFSTVSGATVRNVILLSPNVKATTTINYDVYLGALIGLCDTGSSNRVENCHVVNPTVSSSSTGSRNYVGAIIGNIYNTNTTATNCYYYGGNANAACGHIEGGAPVTRVCAAHLVTPADGVTIQTTMTVDLGFSCDADNNGTPENYWRTGAQLTLNYTGTVPDGYTIGYTATNGGTISGSTLTMPDADVTLTATVTVIPWDGDGSKGNPFLIEYPSQLDLLAYRVNGTHGETRQNDGYKNTYFKLANDIKYTPSYDWDNFDSDESNFEAIGGYNYNFCGHFDGNNKTIRGIRIYCGGTDDADDDQGIFGWTGSGADIHDLTLADARITGFDFTGGIVGYNYGTVSRCHVADDVAVCAVQSDAWNHGGIVGYNYGYIEQCTSAATLTLADANSRNYGGIAGINFGTMSDNLAIGATVPATADNTYGAITGNNEGSLQRNYYAACKVAGTENATGVGCAKVDVNNDDNPDGAVSINTLTLAARQAPDGNFWTTYYNSALGFTIDEDEHACAYTATYGGSQLTLHKLGKEIPAGTAVIIVADNDVVSMTAATSALTPVAPADNDLRGVDTDSNVADIIYKLGNGTLYVLGMTTVDNEQHFGFHRYTGEEMAAHKAFVHVAAAPGSNARSLDMVFEETTGIEGIEVSEVNGVLGRAKRQSRANDDSWYTLDGRKLNGKPVKAGLYVNNGRKVVIN